MRGIKVSKVTKSFGKKSVLENVSTFFKPCTIYGLLGRNGVGKSTLIHLISGRIFADKGEITLDGNKILESAPELERIFAVGQFEMYQGGMKLIEIINDTARFYPGFDEKYVVKLAEKFEIDLKSRYGKLSTGYKTIFKDILALCVPCEYIFFDEPVLGMDASNRNLFYRELIDSYAKRPRTFVISTHLIEEIQNLIENVVIVADHHIILDDSVENILSKAHFVSGTKDDAGKYVEGLSIIGSEFLGNTVGYYVYDELDDGRALPDSVYLDSFDLNKLFLCLTESGGNRDDN